MKHTMHYAELIEILEAARIQLETWYNQFGETKDLETIERIKDLKYKLYESKASWFKIVDNNPF